jgi:NAD/NADP transhydrogenase beta subunit
LIIEKVRSIAIFISLFLGSLGFGGSLAAFEAENKGVEMKSTFRPTITAHHDQLDRLPFSPD